MSPNGTLRAALEQRIATVCDATGAGRSGDGLGNLHRLLTMGVAGEQGADVRWLVTAAVLGRLPDEQEVRALRRVLDVVGPAVAAQGLLAQALAHPGPGLLRGIEVFSGGVLVLAQPEGTDELALLLRGVLPLWRARHQVVEVALSDDGGLLSRVPGAAGATVPPLLVPWRATLVVVGEGWSRAQCGRLATLAQLSGSRVVVVPPDQLPAAAPETVAPDRTTGFGDLLSLIKHADAVVALTAGTARGYRGYAQSLGAQGLPGPRVTTVPGAPGLPVPVVRPAAGGSVTLAVLGGDPVSTATVREAARTLRDRGPKTDVVLLDVAPVPGPAIADGADAGHRAPAARVVVALGPGGIGLLLGAALRQGVPAVVTARGVPAEVARDGGCLLVDPDDDDAVVRAIESLLTDADRHRSLAAEAARRPGTPWDRMATDLWHAVVGNREAGR